MAQKQEECIPLTQPETKKMEDTQVKTFALSINRAF